LHELDQCFKRAAGALYSSGAEIRWRFSALAVLLRKRDRSAKEESMNTLRAILPVLMAIAAGIGCSRQPSKPPDVSHAIRTSLDQAGFKSVSVGEDRDKGVITLGGRVAADTDKAQAESIAKPLAGDEVVANQILVIPPGAERDARKIGSDLDKGIEGNVDAALIQVRLNESVKYAVHNGVVTLTGDVDSQVKRAQAEQAAAAVPYVQQVVNELQVKHQKATSSN
jgi:osmotically-inducible protein OsmY